MNSYELNSLEDGVKYKLSFEINKNQESIIFSIRDEKENDTKGIKFRINDKHGFSSLEYCLFNFKKNLDEYLNIDESLGLYQIGSFNLKSQEPIKKPVCYVNLDTKNKHNKMISMNLNDKSNELKSVLHDEEGNLLTEGIYENGLATKDNTIPFLEKFNEEYYFDLSDSCKHCFECISALSEDKLILKNEEVGLCSLVESNQRMRNELKQYKNKIHDEKQFVVNKLEKIIENLEKKFSDNLNYVTSSNESTMDDFEELVQIKGNICSIKYALNRFVELSVKPTK